MRNKDDGEEKTEGGKREGGEEIVTTTSLLTTDCNATARANFIFRVLVGIILEMCGCIIESIETITQTTNPQSSPPPSHNNSNVLDIPELGRDG